MKKEKLFLYNDISGNEVYANLYHYGKGVNSIYIQGGIHGGELTYFIFEKLHRWLIKNEKSLKSKITLAPIINPPAWNQRIYYYTAGKFDLYKGKDWNRSYNSNTNTTLSANNSSILLQHAKKYDLVIDLHTARSSKPYVIFDNKKLLPFIKDLGFKYNLILDSSIPANKAYMGTINFTLSQLGIPSFVCECGAHDSYEPENIDTVFKGIKGLIEKYCINLKTSKNNVEQFILTQIDTIYAEHSGFAKYIYNPQEAIVKNATLCKISRSDNLGEIYEIKAIKSGMLFEIPKTHIIWKGDELLKIVYSDSIIKL